MHDELRKEAAYGLFFGCIASCYVYKYRQPALQSTTQLSESATQRNLLATQLDCNEIKLSQHNQADLATQPYGLATQSSKFATKLTVIATKQTTAEGLMIPQNYEIL
ncbi:hypothetical protein [Sporosarcina sp. Marseille-Q4943]|uniref:hypothetical protein n=1 Tax=Sporosarcina sp. Marseille-Q4943 TaxID=2942204 RepID=UPI00208DB29B|nr:hypothetical protein [Sporosarcina sp. Marseille-Q4943]